MKFEYKQVIVDGSWDGRKEWKPAIMNIDVLNSFGEMGWRLVSMALGLKENESSVYVFIREKR